MKRMIATVTAAGAAALMLFSTSARADHDRDEGRFEHRDEGREGRDHGWRERREWREHQWRELQRERQVFYARWDGNPWRRARFERWYARRCAELREWR